MPNGDKMKPRKMTLLVYDTGKVWGKSNLSDMINKEGVDAYFFYIFWLYEIRKTLKY